MFYDIFKELCAKKRTSPNAVCKELGFSNSTASFWKKANNPPKREALEKIAAYFGVSVYYLLGKEETKQHKIQGGIRPDEIIAIKGTKIPPIQQERRDFFIGFSVYG